MSVKHMTNTIKISGAIFLLLLSFNLRSNAQTGSNPDPSNYTQVTTILPPTPNAASIGKFGGINLNLSQGALNLAVPLYDYSSINLKLPISLSYNSSSIRVDEVGGSAGMSWVLNAGGTVTRTVYGLPDGIVPRAIPPSDLPAQTDSFLYFLQGINISNVGRASYDGQPDLFSFNFNGYSGRFILDSSLRNPILLTYSGVKIESHIKNTDTGWNFRITTPDGIQYYFGDTMAIDKSSSRQVGSDAGRSYPVAVPTAYYLTKIVHPDGDSIWFSYAKYFTTYKSSISEALNGQTVTTKVIACNTSNPDPSGPADNPASYTLINATGVLMQEINSSGGARLHFHYISRPDQIGQLVSGIDVFQPGQTLPFKSFSLNYATSLSSHFSNSYTDSSGMRRSFLQTVLESSPDLSAQKTYRFDYNDINGLPPRLSYAQDAYGYFNGKNNGTLLPPSQFAAYQSELSGATANRNVDSNYCFKGLLTKVTYPTGGNDSIDYEPNYVYGSVTTPAPDTSVSIVADGGFRNGPKVIDTFSGLIAQTVTIHSTCYYLGGDPSKIDPVHDLGRITIFDITNPAHPNQLYNENVAVGDDWSVLFGFTAGHVYAISSQGSGDSVENIVHFQYQNGLPTNQSLNAVTGGNRVKRVTSLAGGSAVPNIKRYYYATLAAPNVSSAVKIYEPRFDRTTKIFVSCSTGDDFVPLYNEFDFPSLYSTTQTNLFEYGGFPVSYGTVIESFGEHYENGAIEHDFTQEPDLDGEPILGDFLLSAPRTSYSWLNGREIYNCAFKTVDGQLQPVKKIYTHFVQDPRVDHTYNSYLLSQKYVPLQESDPPLQSQFDAYDLTAYSYLQKWLYVDSVTTITYDDNGSGQLSDTSVTYYDNPVHALPTRIHSSTSDIRGREYRYIYPIDTLLTGYAELGRQSLVTKQMLSEPLFVIAKKGSDTAFVERTDYATFSATLVKPQIHNLKNGGASIEPRIQFYGYNNFGKVLEQSKIGDARSSYIWDYHSMYPVAQAINAVQSDIAYTSFEADGSGNWNIGSGSLDSGKALTGRRSYALAGSITKSGLTNTTTYIVSYWTTVGPISIAGSLSGYPQRGKTIVLNNVSWTFYIHKVTGQSTITVSGNTTLDELRLYPATAQMTTATYDPLIGMISQTDIANRVTYYEYDGLQRLKRVRDQDNNILKSFEYQYQIPGGCGAGCSILAMKTFSGSNTISYPVGVFSINGKFVGNAANADDYVAKWNGDAADHLVGTLSKGGDPMHFNLSVNTGQTAPEGVTGCRYYQWDLAWNQLDGIMGGSGAYVDFGDGTGVKLPTSPTDTAGFGPYTTLAFGFYTIHTYSDASLKTITIYHNDGTESIGMDNAYFPATSLSKLSHLRGYFPQQTQYAKFSSMQQPGALTFDSIYNWNSISTLTSFEPTTGDGGTNKCLNVNFAQDFMKNNRGLRVILTSNGHYTDHGIADSTFKLSRLKSDWNTYFTQLNTIWLSDDYWTREDLTGLTHLQTFVLGAGNHYGYGVTTAISPGVTDNIINQIAAGAGQNVSNGVIAIESFGGGRSLNSDASVQFLLKKGWIIVIDDVREQIH
jgi:YD repeat-containing protein